MAKLPEKIGKYKITSLIATGGMGAVYKAVHPTLRRFVILKKLTLRGSAQITERFKREARILMDFRNESIVNVYDHFKEGNSWYIVLEYIDGMSLEDLIKRERYLPSDLALYIFLHACKALKYAHDKNVIHRDIKPANILLSKKGEVKLVDFGIAVSSEDSDSGLTREGMTLGTPSYMSPEQFENSKNVDKRADIYSMGVMLYEMVTGKRPFPGNLSPEAIALIQKGKYKHAKSINPSVSRPVSRILAKTIQPKPSRRFQNLQEAIKKVSVIYKGGEEEAYKSCLAGIVKGKKAAPVEKKKTHFLMKLAFIVLPVLLLLIAGGYGAVKTGIVYEILSPGEYGALQIEVRVPKDYKQPADYFLDAIIFSETNEGVVPLDGVTVRFILNKQNENEEYLAFTSQKIYLKTDNYRIKVMIEANLIWNSIFLAPRVIQKQRDMESDLLLFDLEAVPRIPIEIDYLVTDQITGKNLSAGTVLEVKVGNSWVKEDRLSRDLLTGSVHRFRFTNEGYYTEYFTLMIRRDQRLLNFKVELIPRPGKVRINSDIKGLVLKINGSDTYLTGGIKRELKKTERTSEEGSEEGTELLLPPGEYRFGVERGKEITEATVTVLPDKTSELRVHYNQEDKVISLTVHE
jgi:serine/threonine-protein kinase